jgi:hypothetical protein
MVAKVAFAVTIAVIAVLVAGCGSSSSSGNSTSRVYSVGATASCFRERSEYRGALRAGYDVRSGLWVAGERAVARLGWQRSGLRLTSAQIDQRLRRVLPGLEIELRPMRPSAPSDLGVVTMHFFPTAAAASKQYAFYEKSGMPWTFQLRGNVLVSWHSSRRASWERLLEGCLKN